MPFNLATIHSEEARINRQIKANRKVKKIENEKKKLQYTAPEINEEVKKIEGGPCGDADCKSRRKKSDNTEKNSAPNTETSKNEKVAINENPHTTKSKTSLKSEHKNQKIKKRKKSSIQTRNSGQYFFIYKIKLNVILIFFPIRLFLQKHQTSIQ